MEDVTFILKEDDDQNKIFVPSVSKVATLSVVSEFQHDLDVKVGASKTNPDGKGSGDLPGGGSFRHRVGGQPGKFKIAITDSTLEDSKPLVLHLHAEDQGAPEAFIRVFPDMVGQLKGSIIQPILDAGNTISVTIRNEIGVGIWVLAMPNGEWIFCDKVEEPQTFTLPRLRGCGKRVFLKIISEKKQTGGTGVGEIILIP